MKEKVSFLLDWLKVMCHENRVNIKTRNRIINRSKVFNYRWALDKLSLILVLVLQITALGLQLVSVFWFYKIVRMVKYKLLKRTRAPRSKVAWRDLSCKSYILMELYKNVEFNSWYWRIEPYSFSARIVTLLKISYLLIYIYIFNKILSLTRSFVTN